MTVTRAPRRRSSRRGTRRAGRHAHRADHGHHRSRARAVYVAGPGGALQVLLSSDSFSELSDGVEYLGAVQQSSSDLVLLAEANRERLRRSRERLVSCPRSRPAVDEIESRQKDIEGEDRRDREPGRRAHREAREGAWKKREAEQEAERQRRELIGQNPTRCPRALGLGLPGACPVAGPNSFVDSWGAPRSGGRTHEGTDIIAAGPPSWPRRRGRYGSARTPWAVRLRHRHDGDETYYAPVLVRSHRRRGAGRATDRARGEHG